MLVIDSLDKLDQAPAGMAFAIGNFDGFHLGHLALLKEASSLGTLGLITFEPHPKQLFAPELGPHRLMQSFDKRHAAEAFGVEVYCELPFDQEFCKLSAQEFHEQVLEPLHMQALVCGTDFRYGRDRVGDISSLKALGQSLNFELRALEKILTDKGQPHSSSAIRADLSAGKIREANACLCRDWAVSGIVQRGDQFGRTIGFATANLDLGSYQRPAEGIYAVKVGIGDEPKTRPGAAYFGKRPTVDGLQERFEVHLLDFDGDLYGQELRVAFIDFIRGDKALDGVEALKAQIAEDCQTVLTVLKV